MGGAGRGVKITTPVSFQVSAWPAGVGVGLKLQDPNKQKRFKQTLIYFNMDAQYANLK